MDNRVLDMVAFKKLEKMPTKTELIATIARLLNQVCKVFSMAVELASFPSCCLLPC